MNLKLTGIQPHYTILDESNQYPAAQCQLHLLLAPMSITIATYHIESNTLCNLKRYLSNELLSVDHLKELFLQDNLLQFHYQTYHLTVFSEKTTLVDQIEIAKDINLFEDKMHQIDATIYYQYNKEIIQFLNARLPFQIHAASASLIDCLIKKQQIVKNSTIYAHCFDKFLEVIAFDADKLVLHNIFPIEQPEDFSYYLLSVYESLQFSTSKVGTTLIGNISKPSRIYDLLFTYIKDVDFIKKYAAINYTSAFEDIEEHIIYPIASLMKP